MVVKAADKIFRPKYDPKLAKYLDLLCIDDRQKSKPQNDLIYCILGMLELYKRISI